MMVDASLPPDLAAISGLNQESAYVKQVGKDIPDLRLNVLRDAACAVGARGGFIAQANKNRDEIGVRQATRLDRFAFPTLALKDGLYPPVISKIEGAVSQDGPDMVRLSGVTYRIERAERFALSPITWRDYVFQGFPAPNAMVPTPHHTLLPKTKHEREFWKVTVELCWKDGVAQADRMVSINLAKMEREFYGMALYKQLVDDRLIDAPMVEYNYRSAVGGGNEMIMDDHAYRVVKPGSLVNPLAKPNRGVGK